MKDQLTQEPSSASPTSDSLPSEGKSVANQEELSILDFAIVLARRRNIVLGLPILSAILASIAVLLLPDIYTATTRILPPQQNQTTAAAMLSQLSGGLAAIAGGAAGLKTPADLYVGMLKSRTIADNLVQKFDLKTVYEEKYLSRARKRLEGETTISAGKDGIIVIEVDSKDAKRSAEVANAYVDELFNLTKVLALTEAAQRRLFFERQLSQAKDNLSKAEIDARKALQFGGLVKVDDQGRAMVETTARLRGQIAVKEVQISAMRTFAAEQNPGLQVAQQELAALNREISKIEGTSKKLAGAVDASDNGIDSLGLLRNMKYYETIYELLAKQFELAKIDEAKESALIQVVDRAIEPDRKSKPRRLLIVAICTLASLFAGILCALLVDAIIRLRSVPQYESSLHQLKALLPWRKV